MFGIGRSKVRDRQEEAKNLILEGALIVDVRTPSEYAFEHASGAINIPLDQIEARIFELKKKHKKIVAYCQSGRRSGIAVDRFKMFGIDSCNAGGLDNMIKILNSIK